MSTDGRPECDLIMKGGITSGVAYPAAVQQLSQRFDFVNIGGASAGAIAATVTAAAQYAAGSGGFDRLRELRTELRRPNLLPELFQATRQTRPLLELLLTAQRPHPAWLRYPLLVWQVVRRMAMPTALWTAGGFALLATMLGGAGASWSSMGPTSGAVLGLTLLLVALAALLGCVVFRLLRAAFGYLPTSNFGMCLGRSEDGSGRPALTEWLHSRIQFVAGLPADRPLTFADLAGQGMQLRMMTTDLTLARPVRFPQREQVYHYSPEDFEALFPDEILRHLELHSGPPCEVDTPYGRRTLRPLPGQQLPVLVATRMSLALPVLLAAVPLWTLPGGAPAPAPDRPTAQDPTAQNPAGPASTAAGANPQAAPAGAGGVATERHWISDGGIASNFPMHFFDAWVPVRPTFGLDLVSTGTARADGPVTDAVRLYTDAPPPPRPVPIRSLTDLLRQTLSAMQNWHDTLQSELDGFHDRIVHIDLSSNEGGMNIAMPEAVIGRVDAKGERAGELLRDGFDWPRHQVRRYRTFMGMLQEGLTPGPRPPSADTSTVREAWGRGLEALVDAQAMPGGAGVPPPSWYRAAAEATRALLATADGWLGSDPDDPARWLEFRADPPPVPPARMRVTPDV